MASLGARYREALEDELRAAIAADGPSSGLRAMLHYHLGWKDEAGRPVAGTTGKRLRPLLCLLVCEGYGTDYRVALPAAAAIEMLHNFTLIHDDIQDRSDERHHRPTVWRRWGEAQGINAGDALFAVSRLAVLRLRQREVGAERILAAAELLDRACLRVCEGQYLDIDFEARQTVDEATYLAMVSGKTAALLGCAMEMGALLAGTAQTELRAMRATGEALGLAYQMQDDILGIWGEPAVSGKPAADDLRDGKKTLPVLFGLQRADEDQSRRLRALLGNKAATTEELANGVALLDELGARAYAEAVARRYFEQTLAGLAKTGLAGPARDTLSALVSSLLQRPA
ncbi:MAG: polyprenyl synthetase family protein [Chloroflexota bacterium]